MDKKYVNYVVIMEGFTPESINGVFYERNHDNFCDFQKIMNNWGYTVSNDFFQIIKCNDPISEKEEVAVGVLCYTALNDKKHLVLSKRK